MANLIGLAITFLILALVAFVLGEKELPGYLCKLQMACDNLHNTGSNIFHFCDGIM